MITPLLTVLLGGGPLLIFRRVRGLYYYLSFCALTTGLLFYLLPGTAFSFALCACLALFYYESKRLGSGELRAGLIAILATSGLSSLLLGIWVQFSSLDLYSYAVELMEKNLQEFQKIQPKVQIAAEDVVSLLPSLFVIFLLLLLWLAILIERYAVARSWLESFGISSRTKLGPPLRDFRLPDATIWGLLVSFAFAFLQLDQVILMRTAENFLNIFLFLYFFQGLAVVSSILNYFKVSSIWRSFWYFILIIQMFLFVIMLGLVDFWVDFRKKLEEKRKTERDNQI